MIHLWSVSIILETIIVRDEAFDPDNGKVLDEWPAPKH